VDVVVWWWLLALEDYECLKLIMQTRGSLTCYSQQNLVISDASSTVLIRLQELPWI